MTNWHCPDEGDGAWFYILHTLFTICMWAVVWIGGMMLLAKYTNYEWPVYAWMIVSFGWLFRSCGTITHPNGRQEWRGFFR